jgi:hypothetical protein
MSVCRVVAFVVVFVVVVVVVVVVAAAAVVVVVGVWVSEMLTSKSLFRNW